MKRAGLVITSIGVAASVFAQTWQPATGGSWTNTANWTPATVPDNNTASVVVNQNFTNSPTLPTITLDRSAAITVNKISYNDTTATYYGCTIAAGSPAGSLVFAGTTPTVDTPGNTGAELTISAPVNVSQGLTKTGARYVYLNGAVTGFGSGVYNNISGGMLAIGSATAIDWTTINKTAGGGTLRLDALTTMTAPAALSVGAGELQLNPASGTFAFNTSGFTKSGGGTLRFVRDAAGPGGSAALTVSGGYLSANANLSGFASGTVASGATLQPNAGITYGNIPLTLTGPGVGGSQGALHFRNGGSTTVTWPGAITLGSGGATIGSYGTTYNTTLSGAITGTGPLTILGYGGDKASHTATFTLSAAGGYSGNTTLQNNDGIKEATLKLGVNDALPTGTVLTLSLANNNPTVGVTLNLNGKSQRLAGLTKNSAATASKYRVINSSATASTLTVSNTAAYVFDGLIGIAGNTNFSLVKQGNATLTLSGSNTYSGATSVNGGTLLVSNTTGSGTGTGSVTVNSGGILGGTGVVQGNVTVNSNGLSSFSGTIKGHVTVEGGATLSGSATVQGAVTVAAGAALSPGGVASVGTLALQSTLALNGNTLLFDLPSSGASDLIAITGALTLEGASTLGVNLLNGSLPAGTYTLMTYASINGAGSISLDTPIRNATLTVGATSVTLDVTGSGAGANLTWAGDNSGNAWDINTSALWTNGAVADVFINLDNVTFNDAGSASPSVNLTTNVQPTSVVVSNVANAYTFSGTGAIAGAATLTKLGTNALTLANLNSYSGATTVRAGVLAYGVNDAIGASAVTVTGTTAVLALGAFSDTVGTVTLEGGKITGTTGTLATLGTFELKSGTVSAILAGAGALNQTTPSTVTLSGSNTYSGVTTIGVNGVSNTVLVVNNNQALGSIAAGTTISGGFTITENRINLGSGVTVTDETLTFASANGYRAGLHYTPNSGSAKWDGNIVLSGAASYLNGENSGGTLVIGGSSDDTVTGTGGGLSLRGSGTVIVNSRISIGTTQLNRDDAGLAILNTASNTWGVTQLGQGTLRLGVPDALPVTTTLNIGKAGALALAVFDMNGNNQAISSLGELHAVGGTQRIISSTPATLTVSNSAANSFGTAGSAIEGAVSLVKMGNGTLTLTGTNTTAGAFIVSNGTLVVSSTGMLGNSTNVTVAAGTLTLQNSAGITNTATLRIANGGGAKVNLAAGVNEAVGTLWFGDVQKSAGTYGATGSGADVISDEHFSIAGSGVLTVLHGQGGTVMVVR